MPENSGFAGAERFDNLLTNNPHEFTTPADLRRMKNLILTVFGIVLFCGTHGAIASVKTDRLSDVIQKCDDVDPGDEDHFE